MTLHLPYRQYAPRNNRNILECKYFDSTFTFISLLLEIIETYWNVNYERMSLYFSDAFEIIETYWNVNVDYIGKSSCDCTEIIETYWNVNEIPFSMKICSSWK